MTREAPGHHRVIDGKYELLARIGRGGMSDVWLARDRRLDKLWAVKEIKPNVSGPQGEANRRAILDEANFMKKLDHPAIPRVVDIVEEGSRAFVVMDYVDGVSLGRALRERDGPFDQRDVIDWGIQLCDVLGYLHRRQPPVVYRDMKPGNVMLREDGSLRLVDFGIAEELVWGRGDDGRIIGSLGYSAPEQLEQAFHDAHPTDTRADVYALGATLYSLVTGQVPGRSASPGEAGLSLRPIRQADSSLSEGLEVVILRATRREPDERYQTVEQMRHDLEHCDELTEAYRLAQRRKVARFRRLVRASVASLAAGVASLALGAAVRNSSYETLVHEAGVASAEETNVLAGDPLHGVSRSAEPSEAERLLTRAIEVDPSRMDAYEDLVSVYKADQVLTTTESRRWMQIWQRHGQAIEGDARYARLCYDVGVLYLCYYDYLGLADLADGGGPPVVGQGALESATRSTEWFVRAHDACDPASSDYRGLTVGDGVDEYAATLVYRQIGVFHERFLEAGREGRDLTEGYRELWDGLRGLMGEGGVAGTFGGQVEPIVRLRLYQVAFEAVSSPTYLSGLMHAGVGRSDVEGLLRHLGEGTAALSDFCAYNQDSAGPLYEEIAGGLDAAWENVRRTYGSPVATVAHETEVEDAP